jgi:GTP diphosphokinase / guanosine-3',5'-bis(diphosphate) 3'-diphosphatase
MSNLAKAIKIASVGFENKTDKAGEPYILHCLRVMNNLNTSDNELKSIAVLHDCVEDGVCTISDLITWKFSTRVILAISLLTHDKEISYDDYIKGIARNKDATMVKISDLKDNSDITRLKGLTKKDFDRMEKYHRAFIYLSKI